MSATPTYRLRLTFIWMLCLSAVGLYFYMRPIPPAVPTATQIQPPKTQAVSLPWPSTGQAALGAQTYGVLATSNNAAPVPIASVSKVITAMAILQKKPLASGEAGPTITLDQTDLDYFNNYSAEGGSVAQVAVGEQISQYQALQTMLLPSANNMADSLTRWAFGSPEAYVAYANHMLKSMGLTKTTVGEASGFNDTTTSTADDMVKIGLIAIKNPVFSEIVDESNATVPVAGNITNLNSLLGTNGVFGIKTGNTDKAGGCYLVAAEHQIEGQNITLVAAILGAPNLESAINAAQPLLQSADSGFKTVIAVHKNQVAGLYKTKWGDTAQLKVAKDLSLLVWKGKDIRTITSLDSIPVPAKAGPTNNSVTVVSGGQSAISPLVLSQDLPSPPPTWRVFRH